MARQIAIDLGTSNTVIYSRDKKNIVLRQPSVITVDRVTHEVIAVGLTAKKMLGKAPGNLLASRPLKGGVIADLELTSLMVHEFFERMDMVSLFNRPSALVCIPYGVTEVERRAVEDAVLEAGARNVGLIDEPIAAAVGAKVDVSKARGAMVVDLGGGVSEAAVISFGGVVQSHSVRAAGDTMDRAIVEYFKRKRNLLIGDITAERLKKRLGSAVRDVDRGEMEICGRDINSGKAVTAVATSREIHDAVKGPLSEILSMIKTTLEETPPELSADIFDFGIVLTGGLSLLPGIDTAIGNKTGLRVRNIPHPLESVCFGMGKMLHSAEGDFSEFIRYKGR